MTLMLFCQTFYNQWHFFSQILLTCSQQRYTCWPFWCLISKYTEYDNLFINSRITFCIKIYSFQSCATPLDCWWLTVVFILSTRLQNCNSDYLRYQFKSETCLRRYLTDTIVLSFNSMALQLTAHATQDWLHATAMTLLRSMNGHQTHQILICLIIMCNVPRWKPITSWISQAGQVSNQQSRSVAQDWRWSGMAFLKIPVARAVQNFRKRL